MFGSLSGFRKVHDLEQKHLFTAGRGRYADRAGSPDRWDAKIADFGLHATVNARHQDDLMQHM